MTQARTFTAHFTLGDRVIVGDDIRGTVDRVVFCRNATAPLIAVEWWESGQPRSFELEEEDVRRA